LHTKQSTVEVTRIVNSFYCPTSEKYSIESKYSFDNMQIPVLHINATNTKQPVIVLIKWWISSFNFFAKLVARANKSLKF